MTPTPLLIVALAAAPPADLLDRAADAVDLARDAAVRLTCVEWVREARYDVGHVVDEESRRFHWDLERGDGGAGLVARRAKASGRIVDGPDDRFADLHWPDSHAWLGIVGRENRGFFRFDDLGAAERDGRRNTLLAFRGAAPFDRGEDVREWEGTVELDSRSGLILEIRAAPSTQEGRGAKRYDAYAQKTNADFFGFRFKLGKRPRGAAAQVRFQTSPEGTMLPGELRYETLRWPRHRVTEIEKVQIRTYEDCRRIEVEATSPPPDHRRPAP